VLIILRSLILVAAAAFGVAYWPTIADEPAPRTAGVITSAIALSPVHLVSSR
jgi:hypothetical protein